MCPTLQDFMPLHKNMSCGLRQRSRYFYVDLLLKCAPSIPLLSPLVDDGAGAVPCKEVRKSPPPPTSIILGNRLVAERWMPFYKQV